MYRPEHKPLGDPCVRVLTRGLDKGAYCGLPASAHRTGRDRPANPGRKRREYVPKPRNTEPIVAIDGEGQGRRPHKYTYLAAVDEKGNVLGEVRDRAGLGTRECFDFFLSLGVKRVFGFSIAYDLTKILTDLADSAIYRLNRPDERKRRRRGRTQHLPVYALGYKLQFLRGWMTIQKTRRERVRGKIRLVGEGPMVTLWDVFRFYQSKFTTALIDWKIREKAQLEAMMRMKDQRAHFDRLTEKEVEDYCKEECQCLAELVRKLIESHENVGLKLTKFWGAGATANLLLTKLGVKEFLAPPPDELRPILAKAFFGGRFEISRAGPVPGAIYNYDIASAYPYHTANLPCLACGKWELIKGRALRRRVEHATLACVHATVRKSSKSPEAWGPFPWRSAEGTIIFPRASGGSWVWRDEFFAAEKLFPQVGLSEAWVYETGCDHHPFSELPELYRERVRIGKEGPGIVIKLGTNSCYGKLAQSIGSAQFQSYVLAGVITSNTRAQLLQAMGSAGDWWNVLMVATDGIFSREPLTLPAPRDTGTSGLFSPEGKPATPLGGWEEKVYPRGVFFLRPGVYFPIDPTKDEIKDVKARGMAKGVLLDQAPRIQEHWKQYGPEGAPPGQEEQGVVIVRGVERFVGMKTGVLKHGKKGIRRSENYGEWIDYPIKASFSPEPKRQRFFEDYRLKTFDFLEGESAPYKKANRAPESSALREAEEIFADQPEGDFSEGYRA